MNVIVLGAAGYLGWPTALHLAGRGHRVLAVDGYLKPRWAREFGVAPLLPYRGLDQRLQSTHLGKERVTAATLDLIDGDGLDRLVRSFGPEAIIHYAEQASAPYSMSARHRAVATQANNVVSTLNLMFSVRDHAPDAHIVKLGTMGQYGTPNIDIEEGDIEITHRGRTDRLPFPKQPGSIYHLSKAHDSLNLAFASRVWGLRVTDLNQGIVYGWATPHTQAPDLRTDLHYDHVFGTVLNRFLAQALTGHPLTVHGSGGQTRGFLDIHDTLNCVTLSVENPPERGEYRVFNQFAERFSVAHLARMVQVAATSLGLDVAIDTLPNPRKEAELHHYRAAHDKLQRLGFVPSRLDRDRLVEMLDDMRPFAPSIQPSSFLIPVEWNPAADTTGHSRVGS